jgi:DNA-binding transcriptional ArsR family regulator
VQTVRDVFRLEVDQVRALSHPLRLRMLSVLVEEGPATSTTLARTLGETTGATSYHLRQLAQHGLIRELADRGNGRDRWWEALARSYGADVPESDEARAAGYELAARVVEHDAEVVRAFLANRESYDSVWQDTALFTNHAVWATPDELRSISRRIRDVLAEYERAHARERPEGTKRIYVVLRAVPWAHELDERLTPPGDE